MRLLPRRGFGPVLEIVAFSVFALVLTFAFFNHPPRPSWSNLWTFGGYGLLLIWAAVRFWQGIVAEWRRLDAPRRPGQTALQTVTDGEEG